MMKKLMLLGAVVMLFGVSADTFAQGYYHRGRSGERSDRGRVRRGIRSGQITRDEARGLRERERQIRQERRAYRSDGVLTREEWGELRRDEREQDRLIRSERRDGERRPSYYYGRARRRGDGYHRHGAGSSRHPVFGRRYRY